MIDPGGKSVCADSIGGSALDCTAGPAGTYTIMVSDYDNKFKRGLPGLGRKGSTIRSAARHCPTPRRPGPRWPRARWDLLPAQRGGRGRGPAAGPVRDW